MNSQMASFTCFLCADCWKVRLSWACCPNCLYMNTLPRRLQNSQISYMECQSSKRKYSSKQSRRCMAFYDLNSKVTLFRQSSHKALRFEGRELRSHLTIDGSAKEFADLFKTTRGVHSERLPQKGIFKLK